jgi:hypothetical protein
MDAALIVTLLAAGDYENPGIKKRIRGLFGKITYDYRRLSYPIYAHLYASQAMNFEGGKMWNTYYCGIRDFLLRNQIKVGRSKGYWNRMYHGHSSNPPDKVYATAVSCLILQMPYKYLPLLQYK